VLRNPEERRIRALRMLEYRIQNTATYAEVGKHFHLSIPQVQRILSWARKAELLTVAEDKVILELVPAAHKAIMKALEEGNAQVALEVFKGTMPGFQKQKKAPVTTSSEGDLASYVNELRGNPGLTEGEVVPALAATAEADAEEGPSSANLPGSARLGATAPSSAGLGEEFSEGTLPYALGQVRFK